MRIASRILMLLLLAGMIFLALNRHSRNNIQNYHSEIWADKAGYHVYLPATFIYGFNASAMPDSIDKRTGGGFKLNLENNRIFTKYTYGVALMQMPFFLGAHALATPLGYPADGYSLPYHKAIDLAAAFYGFIGLIFLFYFLRAYFPTGVSLFTAFLVFGGTGVFYYAMFDTGMSHVYSFTLVSAALLLVSRIGNANFSTGSMMALGAVCGLAIAVRPTNALILSGLLIFVTRDQHSAIGIRRIALAILAGCLMLMPQMVYWTYLTGSPIMYSYGDEGFSNILSPEIIHIWFAPHNGLFLYAPILLIALAGLYFMYRLGDRWRAGMLALHFLAFSYVTSSWWIWTYGCSFGSRPFVEYVPLLALPLGHIVQWGLGHSSKLIASCVLICLLIPLAWTQKLMFSYPRCWYWSHWDWVSFYDLLIGPTK